MKKIEMIHGIKLNQFKILSRWWKIWYRYFNDINGYWVNGRFIRRKPMPEILKIRVKQFDSLLNKLMENMK